MRDQGSPAVIIAPAPPAAPPQAVVVEPYRAAPIVVEPYTSRSGPYHILTQPKDYG